MDHKRIRVSGGWDRYSGSREQTLPKQKRACRNKQHTLIGIILEIEKLICSFFTVGGNFRKPRDTLYNAENEYDISLSETSL